jgi:P-type Ca2+ transporter type 2A
MEQAFLFSSLQTLIHFDVAEDVGLSPSQVAASREKHGSNGRFSASLMASSLRILNVLPALPEEPPTPLWRLVLEQFKDQLVIILLASAAISFILAIFEDGDDWTAFVDPAVVSLAQLRETQSAISNSRRLIDIDHPDSQFGRRRDAREQR